jgi:hypothetical protein
MFSKFATSTVSTVSTEPLSLILTAIQQGRLDPEVLTNLLAVLLKKAPFQSKALGGFLKKDGRKTIVPADQVIDLLTLLESKLTIFPEEPISNSDYQVSLASEIVERIKAALLSKEEHGEAKESASKVNLGSYYAAIPILKEVLRELLPQEFHYLLDLKDEHHATLKFLVDDPSIIGKPHQIKLKGVFKDNKENSALVISVDDNVENEGVVYHITTSVGDGCQAKDLGPFCKKAYDEWLKSPGSKHPEFTPAEFTQGSPMLDDEGNFHAVSWLLSKSGSIPMPVGLDIDGTTFSCDPEAKKELLQNPDFFAVFNSPDFTSKNLKGNWPLYLLRQLPSDCIRFITNRRAPEGDTHKKGMTAAFSEIASEFLGVPVTVNIDWEPEKLGGSLQERQSKKALSKMTRALEFSQGNFVFFEDEVARHFRSPYCIAIDMTDSSVILCSGEEPKKPFTITLQGGIGSGKSTVWQIVMKMLEDKGITFKYLATDNLSGMPGGCYQYIEKLLPTLEEQVVLFDATNSSGKKPEFVDVMVTQGFNIELAYLAGCLNRLLTRCDHPTLNAPVAVMNLLEIAATSEDYPEKHLANLAQTLVDRLGYDGMKSWFVQRAFAVREKDHGTFKALIITYQEWCQTWSVWGREARGFKVFYQDGRIFVACQQLQRGAEMMTQDNQTQEDDIENRKFQRTFASDQQALMDKMSDPEEEINLVCVGKDDGMLVSCLLVPKTHPVYQMYAQLMGTSPFHQKILEACQDYPFVPVFQSQKTFISGEDVNACIVTALLSEVVLDSSVAPEHHLDVVLPAFLERVIAFWEASGADEKIINLMFECCCPRAVDYRGQFHKELTHNGPESEGSLRLLGVSYEKEESWGYVSSAKLADRLKDIFPGPAGFFAKTVGQLNELIDAVKNLLEGTIDQEAYEGIAVKYHTFGDISKISPEGFVTFELGSETAFGTECVNYGKIKLSWYYKCHKWEKYLPDILAMDEDVANAVSKHFGSVHFVRKLFTSIPDKLEALVDFLTKFTLPEDEFYQNTILMLKEEVPSTGKKKKKKNKDLTGVFKSKIEGTPKARGFLIGNLEDHIVSTAFHTVIQILGLRPEVQDQYKDIVRSLIKLFFLEEPSDAITLIGIVSALLRKEAVEGDPRMLMKSTKIGKMIQKLYPFFNRD